MTKKRTIRFSEPLKIESQEDVASFLEKFLETLSRTTAQVTPEMTKAISDLVGKYIELKQLAMEQSAMEKALGTKNKEG